MTDQEENPLPGADSPEGGSLADAIAAHLELKKDHGADPNKVEEELKSALGPTRRDIDASADLNPTAPLPPEDATEPDSEPDPLPDPEPVAYAEDPLPPFVESTPEPNFEPEQEPAPEQPQSTGTFEFDWSADDAAEPPAAESTPEPDAPDVLEQTPDFFEETPDFDKLWFDEKPPKNFDF